MLDSNNPDQSVVIDASLLSDQLSQRGIELTTEQVAGLPEDLQRRAEMWVNNERVFPLALLPYLGEYDFVAESPVSKWNPQSLAEEIRDTLTLLGLAVADPEVAFDLIAGFKDEQIIAASDWCFAVHSERLQAQEQKREPERINAPECVMSLLAAEPIEAAPTPSVAAPKAETREQAIFRLQAGLHGVRQRLLERQADWIDKADAAKAAKKSVEDAQDQLNELVGELDEALHAECWQASLPLTYDAEGDPVPAETSEDPAKIASVEQLVDHGISGKQAEKLLDADVETIAELEKRIREVNGWFRKIKGIGESAADKVSDALISWRKQHGYGLGATTEAV